MTNIQHKDLTGTNLHDNKIHTHSQNEVTNLVTDLAAKETSANKGAISGYAPLDANQKVPTVNLGGAGADNTKYLRGDQSWQVPSGGGEAFPVGSVFIAVVSTNPATLLGYGTWTAFGAGRVLVGLDSGDTDFDTVEETGGAKTVQSSAQTFSGNALATHFHGVGTFAADTATGVSKRGTTSDTLTQSHGHTISGSSEAKTAGTPAGTNTPGAATSVVQPYIVCYFWKRTA